MSCPFEREVLLLHDGGITGPRRIVVEAHLAVCEECARTDETLELVGEHLRSADPAPLGAVERTLASLPARPTVLAGLLRPAAAAAVLLLALAWTLDRGRTPPGVPPVRPTRAPSVRVGPERPVPPAPLPHLPRPRGPSLRTLLADLDPDDDAQVDALARHVTREGAFATSELASLLRDDDADTVSRALLLAERAPSPRVVPALVARLEDDAYAARAARLLGTLHAAAAVPALRAALDGPAAVEAREALVQIGGRGAMDALAARARRADGLLDPAMLDALSRADPGRAADLLLDATLPDGELEVLLARRSAALAAAWRAALPGAEGERALAVTRMLGRVPDEASIDVLARAARRVELRAAAVESLSAIGTSSAWDRAFEIVSRTGCVASFARRPGVEAWLRARLERGTLPERRTAITLLGSCGDETALAALARAGADRALENDAIRAIGSIGGPRAVAVLSRWQGDAGVREEWIAALGSTGDPSAVTLLEGVLGDERCHGALCRALGRLDHPESARLLVELLADRRARVPAIESLMALPSRTVVPVLLERLDGGRDSRPVRAVLARIAGRDFGAQSGRWRDWWAGQS